ncbi:MAG: hypothetical protein H6Q89_535 [Myxococcaceae bacterium]|nr:hypothetical protein [Myxococcaceae bacterium]
MTLTLALLASLALGQTNCPPGQTVSGDTQGHCCWPEQAWSASRQTCVGIPRCPAGLSVQQESCAVVCPPGMAVGSETAGHCCWPAQVWSGSRQACVGIPRCPAGMREQGEACAAQASPADVGPPPVPPPAPPPTAPPTPSAEPPPPAVPQAGSPLAPAAAPSAVTLIDGLEVPPGHHVERRARKGLVVSGAAVLGGGWLISVLVAVGGGIYAAFEPTNTCWGFVSTVGWIPLVGAPIALLGQSNPALRTDGGKQCTQDGLYPIGVGVGVVSTAMQWAGLTMLVLGLTLRAPVVVEGPPVANAPPSTPSWFVSLGSSGSPLGVTVGLRDW